MHDDYRRKKSDEEGEEPARVADEGPVFAGKRRLERKQPAERAFDIDSKTTWIYLNVTLLGDKFGHAVSPP
jgi:hypothetical protein